MALVRLQTLHTPVVGHHQKLTSNTKSLGHFFVQCDSFGLCNSTKLAKTTNRPVMHGKVLWLGGFARQFSHCDNKHIVFTCLRPIVRQESCFGFSQLIWISDCSLNLSCQFRCENFFPTKIVTQHSHLFPVAMRLFSLDFFNDCCKEKDFPSQLHLAPFGLVDVTAFIIH